LVVAGGVDGEFAEEFAGRGVDDPDFEVVDESTSFQRSPTTPEIRRHLSGQPIPLLRYLAS